jgi:hypothetical protein
MVLRWIERNRNAPPGNGAKFLQALCRYADQHGKSVTLAVMGGNTHLERYYRQFGFRLIRGTRDP